MRKDKSDTRWPWKWHERLFQFTLTIFIAVILYRLSFGGNEYTKIISIPITVFSIIYIAIELHRERSNLWLMLPIGVISLCMLHFFNLI